MTTFLSTFRSHSFDFQSGFSILNMLPTGDWLVVDEQGIGLGGVVMATNKERQEFNRLEFDLLIGG